MCCALAGMYMVIACSSAIAACVFEHNILFVKETSDRRRAAQLQQPQQLCRQQTKAAAKAAGAAAGAVRIFKQLLRLVHPSTATALAHPPLPARRSNSTSNANADREPPCLTYSHSPFFSLTPSRNSEIKLRASSTHRRISLRSAGWPSRSLACSFVCRSALTTASSSVTGPPAHPRSRPPQTSRPVK